MATIPQSAAAGANDRAGKARLAIGLGLILAFLFALRFVARSADHYVVFSADSYGPYWVHPLVLLTHFGLGSVVVLAGPVQLWTGLTGRTGSLHRWTGRILAGSILVASVMAFDLAMTPAFGWPYGLALGGLGMCWVGCTLIGVAAIRTGKVALHRRWMIRAYVVTFGFVTYRLLSEGLLALGIGDVPTDNLVAAWACWAFPLALTLFVEGVTDVRARTA